MARAITTEYGVSFHPINKETKTPIYRYVYDDEVTDSVDEGDRYLAYFSIHELVRKINERAVNLSVKPKSILELEKLTGSIASHHHMELGSWHIKFGTTSIISNPVDYDTWGAFEVWIDGEDQPRHNVELADVIAICNDILGSNVGK